MLAILRHLLIKIQKWARNKSLTEAINNGVKINAETGKKVLVFLIEGEYVSLAKQDIKGYWKRGLFGTVTLRDIEDRAICNIQTNNVFMANTDDKKLTAEDIKKLQEATKKKQGKIVKK